MFTGIVEAVGTVTAALRRAGSMRLTVESELPARGVRRGDSVSVDGVCLTASAIEGDRLSFDVVAETVSRTTLGKARAGRRVNLERALLVGDRLGGHLVQGHVDGTSRVLRISRRGDDRRARLDLPGPLARFVAEKGSIAIQGVSLTVASVTSRSFEVALVPETISRTTLGALATGDEVHLEVDLLARYLERLVDAGAAGGFRRSAGRRPGGIGGR
ncbi:MAG: riboflavin synthase [Acidobacteriia bacterium]|nr:riboflavin synthase [Terriglobia bacterium]